MIILLMSAFFVTPVGIFQQKKTTQAKYSHNLKKLSDNNGLPLTFQLWNRTFQDGNRNQAKIRKTKHFYLLYYASITVTLLNQAATELILSKNTYCIVVLVTSAYISALFRIFTWQQAHMFCCNKKNFHEVNKKTQQSLKQIS